MDKLIQTYVDFYEPRITEAFTRAPEVSTSDVGLLTESVVSCLSQRLRPLAGRVFVVDFHEHRAEWGLPVDENSTTAITRYLERLGAGTVERWFDTYPVLAELVDIIVDSSISHVAEIMRHWAADRDELIARGFVSAQTEVVAIEHMDSDPHQHGRMVAALRFADGSRVIYKPRSLGPEEFTRVCLEQISDGVGVDLSVCAPESLDRGGYGWQREVVRRGAESRADVTSYYRRYGAVCALLNAVGAVDLHHENILAVGDHPVVLDLETVLHAPHNLVAPDLTAGIATRLKMSLANTLLLPHRLATGPYSVLISGIGVAYQQQSSRTSFVMVNGDTDALDIARRTFAFVHSDNVLTGPDGEPTDVLDYREEFVDGLRRGNHAVADQAENLIDILDARPIGVRQIFRSTAVYAKLLEAATHPDNLRRREDFERIITMMSPPTAGCDRRAVHPFITEVEHAALRRGDIPYFVTESDDIRTQADGRVSLPVTDISPRDRAAHGLRLAGPRALKFEELLVEEGFSELRAARREHEPDYRPSMKAAWSEALLNAEGIDPAAVLQRLLDVSVTVDGVDGVERGWVCGAFGPSTGTFESGGSISLHDAGGILLPFERAATSGGDAERTHAIEARRGLVTLRRQCRERLESVALSVASGALSVDYVLGHSQPGLRTDRWDDSWLDNSESCPVDDPVVGLPGAGLLLAGFPETPKDLLRAIADRLPDSSDRQWETAHGESGLVWARHRMARVLGEHDDAERFASRFDAKLAAAPTTLDPAWCGGHAGLCIAAAEVSGDDSLVRKRAELATTLPEAGAPVDLSVCHGAAGVVQALVHVAQSRGESWPLDLAADYWKRVAEHARDAGYVTGDPARQGLLGYFLGWAGIADTALRLTAALDGEHVWVPLSFTSSYQPAKGSSA